MNKQKKKLAKFIRNPTSLRFAEIHNLLISLSFKHKRISGSHNFYQNIKLPADISIPVHSNDCKPIYKKQVAKLIKKIINSKNYE